MAKGSAAKADEGIARVPPWWRRRRDELLALMDGRDAAYVYDRATVRERCADLTRLRSVERVHFAIKANPHPGLLRQVHGCGLGLECASRGEVERALAAVPGVGSADVLFTPNFAPRDEYAWALGLGLRVTLDGLHPLQHWPQLFRGREVFVRMDPGSGRGHHRHVRTGGERCKFGVALGDAAALAAAARTAGATVAGLHAHTGSGILEARNWAGNAVALLGLRQLFPAARVFNLGGGLGVPDRPGAPALDLAAVDAALLELQEALSGIRLWMEPGRFVVAEAGVLLARVTQVKTKGAARFVGVATGMNSLLRPALYGAHHEIVNLTRVDGPPGPAADVVGPLCESADVLGHGRPLPEDTAEGDVLLLATAGAYGAAMASRYNLREPAAQILL